MTPQKQLIRHCPELGLYGDCHRAALASILDLPILSVPNFMEGLGPKDGKEFESLERSFLASLGLRPIVCPYQVDSLQDLLTSVKQCNPGVYALLGGHSMRGVGHTVVMFDGEIIFDPHPSNCGILGPMDDGYYWVTYIGKLLP